MSGTIVTMSADGDLNGAIGITTTFVKFYLLASHFGWIAKVNIVQNIDQLVSICFNDLRKVADFL